MVIALTGALGACQLGAAPAPSPPRASSPTNTATTHPSDSTSPSAFDAVSSASPTASAVPLPASRPGDPNPRLTPGALNPAVTASTMEQTICRSGYTATIRPPATYTNALKRMQIAEYGYVDTNVRDYEEDHLVSLELGGAPRDPRNLWPEPHVVLLPDGTNVGSPTKDRFENWLHEQVCTGALGLAEAQRQIATDWVGAWEAAARP